MGMTEIALVLVGAACGFAFGWMRSKQLLASAVTRREYDTLMQANTALATKLEAAEQLKSERTAFHERALTAEAENKALKQQMKEQQEQLRAEFTNTANKILENVSTKFSTQSEKQIGDLLNPLRERLGEFQKTVVDSFSTQGKEQHTLKAEIQKIVLQTDGLTKALRGDVKAQGNWGEVILERILEEAGLRKDHEYTTQGENMGLTGAAGNRLQPDVIINLPDGKHIIVDSKVSLTSYERFCSEADELAKAVHLKEFLKSVKNHINGLEQKRYQDIEKLGTPDFVLMFMPVEGAYSMAVQQDQELHSYAWGKKIVIVCPATLFATLRTVASLWRIESQNRNAQEIARQGGALYDKFVGFVDDMHAIGKQAAKLQDTYDQAMNKLKDGRGNLINSVEKIRQLGLKPSKSLPKEQSHDSEISREDRELRPV